MKKKKIYNCVIVDDNGVAELNLHDKDVQKRLREQLESIKDIPHGQDKEDSQSNGDDT